MGLFHDLRKELGIITKTPSEFRNAAHFLESSVMPPHPCINKTVGYFLETLGKLLFVKTPNSGTKNTALSHVCWRIASGTLPVSGMSNDWLFQLADLAEETPKTTKPTQSTIIKFRNLHFIGFSPLYGGAFTGVGAWSIYFSGWNVNSMANQLLCANVFCTGKCISHSHQFRPEHHL